MYQHAQEDGRLRCTQNWSGICFSSIFCLTFTDRNQNSARMSDNAVKPEVEGVKKFNKGSLKKTEPLVKQYFPTKEGECVCLINMHLPSPYLLPMLSPTPPGPPLCNRTFFLAIVKALASARPATFHPFHFSYVTDEQQKIRSAI